MIPTDYNPMSKRMPEEYYILTSGEMVPFNSKGLTNIDNFASKLGITSTLKEIYCKFEDVTSAEKAFWGCTNLKKIENTTFSKVINANGMFNTCSSLKSFPDYMTFENVKLTHYPYYFSGGMFAFCLNLEHLPESMVLPNVTDAKGMFRQCSKLEYLPSNLRLQNATEIDVLFYECTSLKEIPEGFALPKAVINENSRIFYKCKNLKTIPVSLCNILNKSFGASSNVQNGLFDNCFNLEYLPEGLTLENLVNGESFFKGCTSLKHLPSTLTLKKLEKAGTINTNLGIFSNCTSLSNLPHNLNLNSLKDGSQFFRGCKSLTIEDCQYVLDILPERNDGEIHYFTLPNTANATAADATQAKSRGWTILYQN